MSKETNTTTTEDVEPVNRFAAKYDPKFCATIIEFGVEGKSLPEFCAHTNTTRQSVWYWVNHKPEFAEAYKVYKEKCEAWWTAFGKDNLITQKGMQLNATIYKLHMMNRFGWSEKREEESNVTSTVTKKTIRIGGDPTAKADA